MGALHNYVTPKSAVFYPPTHPVTHSNARPDTRVTIGLNPPTHLRALRNYAMSPILFNEQYVYVCFHLYNRLHRIFAKEIGCVGEKWFNCNYFWKIDYQTKAFPIWQWWWWCGSWNRCKVLIYFIIIHHATRKICGGGSCPLEIEGHSAPGRLPTSS